MKLRKAQLRLADQIVATPGALLCMGMSLGKTATALKATRELIDFYGVQRVLIIAPKRVAQYTWPDEIPKWDFSRPLSFAVVVGNQQKRMVALRKKARLTIVNRENLPWLVKKFGTRWPFQMIIYDESSRLKAGKKRTSSRALSEFGALCSVRKKTERVLGLTGTPAPNGIIDLWGQMYFVDLGRRLGTTMTAFKRRWFDEDYMGYTCTPKPNAEKEIMAAVKDVMFSVKAGDDIELPKEMYSNHEVVLSPKTLKEYKRFKREMVSEVYDVEAVSRGVLTNKLLQFSNGSMYRTEEDGERETIHIHDEKLNALDDIVRNTQGENLLIAYSYAFDRDAILKKFPQAVDFTSIPDAYEKWNRGEIPMLLAHPASIGHGLNMQFGGHWLIWYGLTWSLELYQQMNKRLPRPGQKSPTVFIRHIICRGTDDYRVLESMRVKDANQDSVNDAVKFSFDSPLKIKKLTDIL